MIKVSIIVPVYNVEEYLSDCIQSVLQQSYKNIEIILVNDGSTDHSEDICKSFTDERIVYLKKENGGLSSARNYGLKKVTGDFIYFLDSDDYLQENAIEVLVNEQISSDSEIVSSSFSMRKIGYKNLEICNEPVFVSGDNSLFFHQYITNQACAKLYKRELFKNIEYPIGMHYEDVATTFKLYDKAKKVSHTNSGLYCYRIRPGAITASVSIKDIENLWTAYNSIKSYYLTPNNNQIFYEATVLYTIYSRLLKSKCNKSEFIYNENKIFCELNTLNLDFSNFKFKSNMYVKIILFKLHVVKYPVYILNSIKKLINYIANI